MLCTEVVSFTCRVYSSGCGRGKPQCTVCVRLKVHVVGHSVRVDLHCVGMAGVSAMDTVDPAEGHVQC